MIKRMASIFAVVATANHGIKAISAFIPATTTTILSSSLNYHPEQPPPYLGNDNGPINDEYYDLDLELVTQDVSRAYERGVECVNNFGLCEIDEVLDLSEELDEYLDCYIGNSPQDCQAEVDDRQDLAEVLLVQAEMREDQEQQSYMQGGNGGYRYDAVNSSGGGAADNGISNVNDSLPRTSVWRSSNEQFVWGDDSSMGV